MYASQLTSAIVMMLCDTLAPQGYGVLEGKAHVQAERMRVVEARADACSLEVVFC